MKKSNNLIFFVSEIIQFTEHIHVNQINRMSQVNWDLIGVEQVELVRWVKKSDLWVGVFVVPLVPVPVNNGNLRGISTQNQ